MGARGRTGTGSVRRPTTKIAGKMPAVPGRTGRDGNSRRGAWGRSDLGRVGRVCRFAGAHSLLGTVSIIRSLLAELQMREAVPRRGNEEDAGKMPAVPGWTGRDGNSRRGAWGRSFWGGVGRVCRSDGAQSFFGTVSIIRSLLTELQVRVIEPRLRPNPGLGRTSAWLVPRRSKNRMPARCRRSQGGRDVIVIPEGVRGDGGGAVWEGSVYRSDGAQSLLGAVSIIRSFLRNYGCAGPNLGTARTTTEQ
jgi:hypothetical protein